MDSLRPSVTRGTAVSLFVCLVSTSAALACGSESSSGQPRASRPDAGDRNRLSVRCEASLEGQRGAAIRELESPLGGPQPTVRFGVQGPPLGSVDGAAWSGADSSLHVLDGVSKRVRVYGARGGHRYSFGHEGEGPGEFEAVGGGSYFNRIAVGADHVAVRGHGRVHLFRRPDQFRHRVEPAPTPGLLPAFNVSAFTDSTFMYAVTRAFDYNTDYETRTGTDLKIFRPDEPEAHLFAQIRNETARLPRFDSLRIPESPWTTVYDRLWDANSVGLVAVSSLRYHGVCFFDATLDLVGSYRVHAPVVEVDDERKERVLDAREEEYGPRAPMVGTPWDEFYDYWPPDLPRYTDIVLRSDSVVWLRRPISETRWYSTMAEPPPPLYAVDAVHPTRGYLGTFESRRFPVAFMDDCPLVVETDVPGRASEMDSAFHGLVAYCPNP